MKNKCIFLLRQARLRMVFGMEDRGRRQGQGMECKVNPFTVILWKQGGRSRCWSTGRKPGPTGTCPTRSCVGWWLWLVPEQPHTEGLCWEQLLHSPDWEQGEGGHQELFWDAESSVLPPFTFHLLSPPFIKSTETLWETNWLLGHFMVLWSCVIPAFKDWFQ